MRRNIKNLEKGAISAFVMMSMIFFLVTVVSVYLISSKRAQAQTESVKLIQNRYYTEDRDGKLYDKRLATLGTIPIYTKEQLWSIDSGNYIEIDGIVYKFDNNVNYELKNDIIINIAEIDRRKSVNESHLTKNNYDIYYYYQGNYYVPYSSGNVDLTISGDKYQYKNNLNNELGYITNGLILHYDGIKNTNAGHDNSVTTWKDLSGNGNDGILNGGVWNNDNLRLDGLDDGISIGNKLNTLFCSNNTIEMVLLFEEENARDDLIGNFKDWNNHEINYERLATNSSARVFYSDGIDGRSDFSFLVNKILNVSYVLERNNSTIKLFNNSTNVDNFSKSLIGTYNYSWNDVWIGRDNRTGDPCLKGKIYSVRVYNRALSNEEISNNYNIDKLRFNME